MHFAETPIKGAFLIDAQPMADERGSFTRLWCEREFVQHGLTTAFVQANTSVSDRQGTLRGLHYQLAPHDEVKLVRCIRGSVYDVIVDVRPGSPTYLRWHGVELSARNARALYVPHGLAHGYLTLEDDSEVMYPVSGFYHPGSERGVRWDDPLFGIGWPATPSLHISTKDCGWPDFVPETAKQQP
jgi:dTDP-4-dehydrorhamnose 3,5-epimerase